MADVGTGLVKWSRTAEEKRSRRREQELVRKEPKPRLERAMVPGLNDDKKQIKLESWEPVKRKIRNKGKENGRGSS